MTVISYYWWDITPTSFPADEKEKSNSAYYGHLHRYYPHYIRKLPFFSNGTNLAVAEQIASESGSACQTHVQNLLNRI